MTEVDRVITEVLNSQAIRSRINNSDIVGSCAKRPSVSGGSVTDLATPEESQLLSDNENDSIGAVSDIPWYVDYVPRMIE